MSNTSSLMFRLPAVVLCGALLCGCGGPPAKAPAGDDATAGAEASGGAAKAVKPPDASAVDLRKLSPLEHAKLKIVTPRRIEGVIDGKATEVFAHYRTGLETLGWKLAAPLAQGEVAEKSASALFVKGPNSVALSVGPLTTGLTGQVSAGDFGWKQFSIDDLGTCDSGKLPQLPGTEKGPAGTVSSVYYTDMAVASTAMSVRALMASAGWQEFENPREKTAESPLESRADFRKEANVLHVLVRKAPPQTAPPQTAPPQKAPLEEAPLGKAPADKAPPGQGVRTSVEYVIGAVGHMLPAPADARDVRFDDAGWSLTCTIPRDLEIVARYYLEAMRTLGYEAPRDLPYSESDMAINFQSEGGDFVLLKLHHDGLSTHAELLGVAGAERKTDNP